MSGLTKRLRELVKHREKYKENYKKWDGWSPPFERLLEDWNILTHYYISKGMSKSASYEKVAEQYGTSRPTLIYWLTPGYRKEYLRKGREKRKKRKIQRLSTP